MENGQLTKKQNETLQEFRRDSSIIGEKTDAFLRLVYPAYLVDQKDVEQHLDAMSSERLESMSFFRIVSCTADHAEDLFVHVCGRFQKLLTALHAVSAPITYGIISRGGVTNLVLGIYPSATGDIESVTSVTQGVLSGIELCPIRPVFSSADGVGKCQGLLSGVPSLYVNDEKQSFSLSSIMRSLNGRDYTLLFVAKPVDQEVIAQNIAELISIRDEAFAVSKRNIARSESAAKTTTDTSSTNDTKTETQTKQDVSGSVGNGIGTVVGTVAGAIAGTILFPGAGTAAGAAVGGSLGASVLGGLGTMIGNLFGKGRSRSSGYSRSTGYSKSISEAITKGETISGDIQNGFALELMNYTDTAIERLKAGQDSGMWQMAIAFAAPDAVSCNIIRACLCGELSKPDPKRMPLASFDVIGSGKEVLRIPRFLGTGEQNALCALVNSSELGLLCTVPTESVPDFELRLEKKFPLIADRAVKDGVQIGHVADGKYSLGNMPFSLGKADLNKHTFVCGITGSGKTTTVKKILIEAKKPFLVIESAKKEYRNLAVPNLSVYTPGKPEIHAPKMNPFYILPGVSPQVHIDYLKDLFNASFSFYGPMPYILEKCLHTVYSNKGWDLTLGYHPLLVNSNNPADFFNIDYTRKRYANQSHRFLFPTMQELKDEIARYVDEDLRYDGEVAGNVKTALKVRLENLCIGAKGYTFNTNEFLDFDQLLNDHVVFELEGLADDSDKAFSVGMLLIFVNEYRQVQKEISGNQTPELRHLLVIEEAHRLLKNVDTERTTETSGNPKGKAVEHFTNMIAEMRSYGQGVIVAEQIPSKLAPDVIKNSSTKIVHRIVSADDQHVIANTVGISDEDALQLGFLETGYAYCHKEGMALPVSVRISDTCTDPKNPRRQKSLDAFVSDEILFNKNENQFDEINLSIVRSALGGDRQIKDKASAFLNTLMCEDADMCVKACRKMMQDVSSRIRTEDIRLVLTRDAFRAASELLTETVLTLMVRGVYCAKELPADEFGEKLKKVLYAPTDKLIQEIKTILNALYPLDPASFAKNSVAASIGKVLSESIDFPGTIRGYFLIVSDKTVHEIETIIKGGQQFR